VQIAIVSASVGAGHDGVAYELGARLTERGAHVSHWDFLDLLPQRLGQWLCRAYAAELAMAPNSWGWVLSVLQQRHAAAVVNTLTSRAGAARMVRALTPEPSLVVSTYPLASQVLGGLRAAGRLNAPVVTYLTDMSVHRLWVAAGVDLHLALHPVAAGQATALGAYTHIIQPATSAEFHPGRTAAQRQAVRARYGIAADRPAALVVGGSWGVGQLDQTVADVAATGVATPVALCGNNIGLRQRLARLGHGPALGWIDEMGDVISACDVVIQNAGGLTSLQALATGVPVVSYRCISGHGITNAAALAEAGLAPWVRDPADLGRALRSAMATPAPRLGPGDDPADVLAALAGMPAGPGLPVPAQRPAQRPAGRTNRRRPGRWADAA
jgi:UDP-N-acetylglucosamine:LPS N-acetylglucosamine transferase